MDTISVEINDRTYVIRRRLDWASSDRIADLKGSPIFVFDGNTIRGFEQLQDFLANTDNEFDGEIRMEIECDTAKLNYARLNSRLVDFPARAIKNIPPGHKHLLIRAIEQLELEEEQELKELEEGNPTMMHFEEQSEVQ